MFNWQGQWKYGTYIIGYYVTIKKNEVMNFASKWIELEKIILWGNPDPEMQRSYVLSH